MMFKKSIVLFVFSYSFLSHIVWATMFFPLPFDKQVEEANSGVEAKLSSSKVFKNNSGTIMTEYRFDVLESHNFSSDDLDNKQLVLTMPGGTYDGVTSMIDGAPQFKVGEKAFLLLKKIESKIYLSNFTLGKFKIQNVDGQTYYVSEVFPMDPHIGRISKNKMIDLMKEKWKVTENSSPVAIPEMKAALNRTTPSDTFDKSRPRFEQRAPAQENAGTEETPMFFWGALFSVVFFFSIIFLKLAQGKKRH